jgi:uncharacterized protein YbjT (DUF2867 family)
MDKGKSLLLLGATGLVGGECLRYLRNDDHFSSVTILARRRLPDRDMTAKMRQHVIDFEKIDRYRDMIRADVVVCALGSTMGKAGSRENFYKIDFEYPYQLAKIARENGAGHFLLVSAAGADARSPFFYNRVKGELEAAVAGLGYDTVSIFRPSLLLGARKESRPGEVLMKLILGPLSFAVPGKYRPVPARTVAAAVLQAARSNQLGVLIFAGQAITHMGKNFPAS